MKKSGEKPPGVIVNEKPGGDPGYFRHTLFA